jgi:hypothetical protein
MLAVLAALILWRPVETALYFLIRGAATIMWLVLQGLVGRLVKRIYASRLWQEAARRVSPAVD